MTIPAFLTSALDARLPNHALRQAFFNTCLARWRKEPGIRLETVTPGVLGVTHREFQRERRIWADKRAKQFYADYHILADDDCLLPRGDLVVEAVRTAKNYPDFYCLSFLPVNAEINPWKPQGFEAYEDDFVMEHASVGGIRVCKTGSIDLWPDMEGPGYDREYGGAVRIKGGKVGYFKKFKMLHLGEGESTVWDK